MVTNNKKSGLWTNPSSPEEEKFFNKVYDKKESDFIGRKRQDTVNYPEIESLVATPLSYFSNYRSSTFIPVPETEWEESGFLPRNTTPFIPYSSEKHIDVMTFFGGTKTGSWLYYNNSDVENQLDQLKSIGVNSVRVYLDFYCWKYLGNNFISKLQHLASICDSKYMYLHLVLFDGYTHDEPSYGYYDPSNIYQAIGWGLKGWQRCPSINQNAYLKRDLEFLTSEGNEYIDAIYNAIKGYYCVKCFEIMSDVNPQPNELEFNDFFTSAINKVKSIKKPYHKITASFKNLNYYNYSATVGEDTVIPDIFIPNIDTLVSGLDFVTYISKSITYAGMLIELIRAKEFSEAIGKPVLSIQDNFNSIGYAYNYLDFSLKLNLGFSIDTLIDFNLGSKPNNNTAGILFTDGQVRDLSSVSLIRQKAVADTTYLNNVLDSSFNTKTDFTFTVDELTEDYSRYYAFGSYGQEVWDLIIQTKQSLADTSANSFKFAPINYSDKSKTNGYGIANLYDISFSSIYNTLDSLQFDFTYNPLRLISNELQRDLEAYKRINILLALENDLDFNIYHNFYLFEDIDMNLVDTSIQNNISSLSLIFKHKVGNSLNPSCGIPYIGDLRYFSSIGDTSGPYRDPIESMQKPIGYFYRDAENPSGFCLYSQPVDPDITVPQNVISKINWAAYDDILLSLLSYIKLAYQSFDTNIQSYNVNFNISNYYR